MSCKHWLIALVFCGAASVTRLAAQQPTTGTFAAGWDGRAVRIDWSGSGPFLVRRSTDAPGEQALHPCPVTVFHPTHSEWQDDHVANGVTYYYTLSSGSLSQTAAVTIPAQPLRASQHPDILVDKKNYLLEVWDGQELIKRYPIALGAGPVKRKLNQDKSTTPEGRYHITHAQPVASFYRAYDINYPNAADRARHQLVCPRTPIGGEIQIHGQGIDSNWTWGCMALRNEDMDELFDHDEIGQGTCVWIFGGELSLADLESDESASPQSPFELGRRQLAAGLKLTCLWDVASQSRLGR